MIATAIPRWQPQPDVWLVVALFAVGYVVALSRIGPRSVGSGRPIATRLQVTSYGLGLVAMFVAASWPIHEVAEQQMFSVHMVQHLVLTMIVPPLLLLGTPAWLLRALLRPGTYTFNVVRAGARFFPAIVVFNVVLVLAHWPAVVSLSLRSGMVHFLVHVVLFVTSLVVWLPVVSPLPEIPRLSPPLCGVYLFTWSILPTIPASFLTFGSAPLYSAYEGLPKLWGMDALLDQQVAGLIMKIAAGLLLWALIAVAFFRWAADADAAERQQRRTRSSSERDLAVEELR